jgi:hypothetical protein
MADWIAATWPQVWPNLLADALWQPPALLAGFLWHHRRLRRHITSELTRIDQQRSSS